MGELRRRIAIFEESPSDDLEKELYLAASAKAYWEIGHLPESLRTRLSRLVESDTDAQYYDQADLLRRGKLLPTSLINFPKRVLYRKIDWIRDFSPIV